MLSASSKPASEPSASSKMPVNFGATAVNWVMIVASGTSASFTHQTSRLRPAGSLALRSSSVRPNASARSNIVAWLVSMSSPPSSQIWLSGNIGAEVNVRPPMRVAAS